MCILLKWYVVLVFCIVFISELGFAHLGLVCWLSFSLFLIQVTFLLLAEMFWIGLIHSRVRIFSLCMRFKNKVSIQVFCMLWCHQQFSQASPDRVVWTWSQEEIRQLECPSLAVVRDSAASVQKSLQNSEPNTQLPSHHKL